VITTTALFDFGLLLYLALSSNIELADQISFISYLPF